MTYSGRVSPYLRGGDPAPGEPGEVRRVLLGLRRTVEAVEAANQVLQAVGVDAQLWTGPAADQFATKRGELQQRLAAADQAYSDAGNALERWLHQLEDAQAEAARIVAQAAAVMRQQPPDPNAAFALTPSVPPALQAVQRRYDMLTVRASGDARCCAQALRAAAGSVGKYADSWWENVTHLLTEASDLLQEVTPWLGLAAMVFPVLGPWVLAIEVVALTIDVVLAVEGSGSWGDVAKSAVGVGLSAGFLTAGRTGELMVDSAGQATTFEAAGFTHAAGYVAGRTTLKGAAGAVVLHPIQTLRDGKLIGTALTEATEYVVPGTLNPAHYAGTVRLGETLHAIGELGDAAHTGYEIGDWVHGHLAPDGAESRP